VRIAERSLSPVSFLLTSFFFIGRSEGMHIRRPPFRLSFLLTPFFLVPQMPFAFEKLIVYQKAMDFSDRICGITQTFPRGFYFLVDQLNRAALSIAANIAEGNGRFTIRDRKNFFGIARGSVQECVPLLELAKRRGLIGPEVIRS